MGKSNSFATENYAIHTENEKQLNNLTKKLSIILLIMINKIILFIT